MNERNAQTDAPNGRRPVGELTRDLAAKTSELVRKEVELASAELREKGSHAAMGAGLLGGAGLVGFFAAATLIAAVVLGLAELMAAWLAALVVAAALGIVAAFSALAGKGEVERATPPAPERATESVREDVEAVKEAARR